MKKLFLLALTGMITCGLYAQNRKGAIALTRGSDRHQLYFAVKGQYDLRNADPVQQLFRYLPGLAPLLEGYDYSIGRGVPMSEQQLTAMEAGALAASGSAAAVSKLRNIFTLDISDPSNSRLYALALKLEQLDGIDYASLMPMTPVAPPAADIPPVTTDYRYMQGYIDADPGVNMKAVWPFGLKGSGIRVRDVEYGFNKDHEDLNPKTIVAPALPISSRAPVAYTEHGTAVSGIMNAPDNGYGVSGMVSEIDEFVLYPEWSDTTYNRVRAITQAIGNSRAGDVVVYEMQTGGVADRYVPAEYDNVVWDLTKAATDADIIIVAAAGNGSQNLDSPGYADYMARGNSGAIIVGAGEPFATHNKLPFSSCGSRVDLHAWGGGVMTTGYGDYIQVGGDFNQSYTLFSGTSSATPIVASCVVALQGYYHKETGHYLTTERLLDLLKTTGIPQGDPAKGHIGPLPDMSAAFEALKSMMTSVGNYTREPLCSIFPNPATQLLNIIPAAGTDTRDMQIAIRDVLGRELYRASLDGRLAADISAYADGIYFVQVTKGGELLRTVRIQKQ